MVMHWICSEKSIAGFLKPTWNTTDWVDNGCHNAESTMKGKLAIFTAYPTSAKLSKWGCVGPNVWPVLKLFLTLEPVTFTVLSWVITTEFSTSKGFSCLLRPNLYQMLSTGQLCPCLPYGSHGMSWGYTILFSSSKCHLKCDAMLLPKDTFLLHQAILCERLSATGDVYYK